MRNAVELKYSAGLFEKECYLFERLHKFDENIDDKNRELLIENRNLKAEIKRLQLVNFIDDTTGIYNKKYLKIRLKEEFARARRRGLPLSSIFIDLDDFKSINDTYGHIMGDWLLKEVASVLDGLCRSEDVLIRFGGEEFVVLMSDTNGLAAAALAERIRKKVEGHCFICEDIEISVSASIGVSAIEGSEFEYVSDPEELICMADRAMYTVKRNGKNNTCYSPFRLEMDNPIPPGVTELQYKSASL